MVNLIGDKLDIIMIEIKLSLMVNVYNIYFNLVIVLDDGSEY